MVVDQDQLLCEFTTDAFHFYVWDLLLLLTINTRYKGLMTSSVSSKTHRQCSRNKMVDSLMLEVPSHHAPHDCYVMYAVLHHFVY